MPVKLSWDTSSTENESSSISDFSFSSDCFGHTLIKGDNYPVLKKLLEKIHRSTGATVIANLGGRGFSSHPYVYMPCAAVIDEDIDIFTRTEKEYFESC